MAKIGIFYGSTEGNTERVVTQIQTLLGGEAVAALHNVNSATADDMQPYPYLILACPTWEIGQLQEDWDLMGFPLIYQQYWHFLKTNISCPLISTFCASR